MTEVTDKTMPVKKEARQNGGAVKNQGDLLHDNLTDYGGQALRAAREKAGIDIPTLSFELRIPKNYLRALEDENYDELPGKTYGYGYIKSYCKFIGIDDQPFLDTYKMRTSMGREEPKYHFPDEALEPRMSGAMMAMLVVLVMLSGYIGWQVYERLEAPISVSESTVIASNQEPIDSALSEQLASNSGDNVASEAPQADKVDTSESVEAPATSATQDDSVDVVSDTKAPRATAAVEDDNNAPKPSETAAVTTQLDDTDALSEDTQTQTDNSAEQTLSASASSQDDTAQLQPSASAQATERMPSEEIVITANAAAWVEVVSENGDVVLSKLFQAGDDYIAPANQKLYLSTGNAGGLVLMIPGLDSFTAGAVGEIIRDLPLSRESIRSRRSAISQ